MKQPVRDWPEGKYPVSRSRECKRCGAPIVFVKSEKGKDMPADAVEVEGDWKNTLIVVHEGVGKVFTNAPPTVIGRLSHFATCPFSSEFKR